MNDVSVLAIIPARGGSKGVKRKNITSLGGLPLIAHTLKAVNGVRHEIDHIVSTEDEEIKEVSVRYGGYVPFLRPVELAMDDTNIVDVINDILVKMDKDYEYIMLLQPTAPLRTADDIDAVLELAILHNADSVCSFAKMETYHPWYMYYLKSGGRIRQIVPTKPGRPRQEFPEVLWRNGAVYLVKTEFFKENEKFITGDCVPYVMPPERSVNIDTRDDLLLAEFYIEKSKNQMSKVGKKMKI